MNSLYKHQIKAIEAAAMQPRFAYFMEQGTGKTLTSLEEAKSFNVDKFLVISPKSAMITWCNEVSKWRNDLKPSYLKYTKKALKEISESNVLCVNFDSVHVEKAKRIIWNFIKGRTFALIIDEAHFVKNISAKRSVTCYKISKLENCKYVRLLTGTPSPNGALDTRNLFRFLDHPLGELDENSFKKKFCKLRLQQIFFKDKKGNIRNKQVYVIDGYKNLDVLSDALAEKSFRVLKKDCLDLPDKIYETKIIEMPQSTRNIYDGIKNDMIAEVESGEVSVNNALTKFLKLQQLCSGFVVDDEGELNILKECGKVNAVIDELEDGNQAIVFCRFTKEIEMLEERFKKNKISYVKLTGKTTLDKRGIAVKSFQNKECQVFLAQVDAASTNLTLTNAEKEIYFSNSLNLATRLQSEDRAHRIGQNNSLVIIDIVTKDSVEEKILQMLLTKKNISAIIAKDVRSLL